MGKLRHGAGVDSAFPFMPWEWDRNFMEVFTQSWPKSTLLPMDTQDALHMEQGCPTHFAPTEGKINQTNRVKNSLLKVLTAGSDQSLPAELSLEKLGIFYPCRIIEAKWAYFKAMRREK